MLETIETQQVEVLTAGHKTAKLLLGDSDLGVVDQVPTFRSWIAASLGSGYLLRGASGEECRREEPMELLYKAYQGMSSGHATNV